jgi:chain length determinant protein EpsF
MSKLSVDPSRESSVLTISFNGVDPQFVSTVTNAFAAAYLEMIVQLKTDPAAKASGFITGQTKVLREQYEQAQSRLTKYQQDNNIYSADDRVDIETARLNELSSQLVAAQGTAIDAGSRQRQAQGDASVSPDVLSSGLIQGLKANLAAAEGKFADTQARLAPNHPVYIAAKAEVDNIRASLNQQIKIASSGLSSNTRISQQREGELRAALTAQKAKVQALNGARDEFNVLTNEMENARKAYEVASQRFNVTNFESQSKQADVAVLTAATTPLEPSGPRTRLNAMLAVVIGLILGMGAVLVLELLDQRVRSATHLHDAFGLPVLGVIDKPRVGKRKSAYKALPKPSSGNTVMQA